MTLMIDGLLPVNGFWLPCDVQDEILSPATPYETLSLDAGRPCQPGEGRGVTARWPRLDEAQWRALLARLQANRSRAPQGRALWERLRQALTAVGRRLTDPSDGLRNQLLAALPAYTGYDRAMIAVTLGAFGDLVALEQLPLALASAPTWQAAAGWQPMAAVDALPGRLRFFPAHPWQAAWRGLPGRDRAPLFGPPALPDLVVGFGAGNVPGTALLLAFLGQACSLVGGPPPASVIRNSRQEPIFAPLILGGLEAVDPDLVCNLAVLVWDYDDPAVQRLLFSAPEASAPQEPRRRLVIAAAGDDTIAQIQQTLYRWTPRQPPAFHPHGHKVSFSAIGREVLGRGLRSAAQGASMLEVVALLAGLDSVFWDQNGCLSSRLHFVETGGDEDHTPLEYAQALAGQLRRLSSLLPRGAWPRQHLHDRFDRYKSLEAAGQVQALTGYDDDFLVVLDARPPGRDRPAAAAFRSLVNDCQGRVVVVRPVADLLDVPQRYLRLLPPANLQSLSVAVGRPGQELSARFLDFAAACGRCGVTAIRTVGRGAFPQLAYSWDGLIPLDLARPRPAGRFCTIEFDYPFEQMLDTYHRLLILT